MDRRTRNEITDWRLNGLDWVAIVLLIIGGLNWGLVGFFNFNLVDAIFGTMSVISRIIYCLVGLSGLWGIISLSTHLTHRTYGETPGAVVH
jgi:uncharacterized membrane protein YuzA (DUF378 family)